VNDTKIKTVSLLVVLMVVATSAVLGQTPGYTPGEFQSTNPYYPKPNPFYFEGKIDWDKLQITTPGNAWEFMQRGIHKQDDLGDIAGAIQDYQTSLSTNGLSNNTCQIVTSASFVNGALPSTLTPPPCMFTVRLRLAYLLRTTNPDQAISLYKEVLMIDPLRLDVNELIAETYEVKAEEATDPTEQNNDYLLAINYLKAELALSPVTPVVIAQTGDTANNAHAHWALAEIYEKLGMNANAKSEYQSYLDATKWHSDVYPWRIALAQERIQTLKARQ
jgi:tetratricopeptide (TPR) repeat protein